MACSHSASDRTLTAGNERMNCLEQEIVEATHTIQVVVLSGERIHELRNQLLMISVNHLDFVDLFIRLSFDIEQFPNDG